MGLPETDSWISSGSFLVVDDREDDDDVPWMTSLVTEAVFLQTISGADDRQ